MASLIRIALSVWRSRLLCHLAEVYPYIRGTKIKCPVGKWSSQSLILFNILSKNTRNHGSKLKKHLVIPSLSQQIKVRLRITIHCSLQLHHHVRNLNILLSLVFCSHLEDDVLLMFRNRLLTYMFNEFGHSVKILAGARVKMYKFRVDLLQRQTILELRRGIETGI